MNISILLFVFATAFVVALALTPFISRFALKKNWVDNPGKARSMHTKRTPRAGGLAIIVAFFAGLFVLYTLGDDGSQMFGSNMVVSRIAFPLGSLAILFVGLYDDAYGLGFKKKFFFQGLIAYTMFLAGFRVSLPEINWIASDPHMLAALELPLTVFWYIWVINAVNLIDGLDGLASGITLIALASLASISALTGNFGLLPIAAIMTGALLGFLRYNFNPASIFLGDTGSLFLGFVLATCGLNSGNISSPVSAALIPIIAIGFPLLDTSVAFIRRYFNGLSPFAPDKEHIHHRLIHRLKLSVKGSVIRLYALNIFFGLIAVSLAFTKGAGYVFLLTALIVITGLFLRRLGYIHLQKNLQVLSTRFKQITQDRKPRGEWAPGQEENEVAPNLNSTLNEPQTPVQSSPKRPRPKRDLKDWGIQTIKR